MHVVRMIVILFNVYYNYTYIYYIHIHVQVCTVRVHCKVVITLFLRSLSISFIPDLYIKKKSSADVRIMCLSTYMYALVLTFLLHQ